MSQFIKIHFTLNYLLAASCDNNNNNNNTNDNNNNNNRFCHLEEIVGHMTNQAEGLVSQLDDIVTSCRSAEQNVFSPQEVNYLGLKLSVIKLTL